MAKTISLLKENLRYSGDLQFFVGIAGDDDTPERIKAEHPDALILKPPVGLLGNNLNHLLYSAFRTSPIVMQMDDDHWLHEPLYMNEHVETIIHDPVIKWIRLMGVANHSYIADLNGKYWVIRWDSEGPFSLYIPSNRPHLKHVKFHETYGLYPENLRLGLTEEGFCHQCRDISSLIQDPLKVAVPLTYNDLAWEHVGDSWQKKGL